MDHLTEIIVPIACGCVLPIMIIYFGVRQKINETNQRTRIIVAAIEKNSETDIEALLKKMAPKEKLLKEKLLNKLLVGCLTIFMGLGLFGFMAYVNYIGMASRHEVSGVICGVVMVAVGIAYLINYFIGKKMLAKELEAEQQKLKN
jgi:hypothetical protein